MLPTSEPNAHPQPTIVNHFLFVLFLLFLFPDSLCVRGGVSGRSKSACMLNAFRPGANISANTVFPTTNPKSQEQN